MFRKLLTGAATAAAALAFAHAAAAVTVVNVGVTSNDSSFDHLNLSALVSSADANPDVWAPGIVFTETTPGGGDTTELVFCVDLEHIIYVTSYNPGLNFDEGFVQSTGSGAPVAANVSNEIGQLADIGRYLYNTHATNYAQKLVAVQGAIWSLEYGGIGGPRATSANATVDHEIVQLLAGVHDNGLNAPLARSLLSDPHTAQNMTTGGVPEPAAWALMIGGFGMAGAMLRRKRRAAVAA